ncbi:putative nuclease HARBI1 [Ischnura elegans]|uniref:putative nuclease HARBI1 n=1 Tax=Ischnura elegans TaxID=197161 RepID=UPI001ED8B139|nr:putative nuclease HARBI1 [Ischnura elegans]
MADINEGGLAALNNIEEMVIIAAVEASMAPAPYLEDDEEDRVLEFLAEEIREERNKIPRIEGFVERIIPSFSSAEFQSHFRLLPETFEFLLGEIGESLRRDSAWGRVPIAEEKQILISLWRLATPDSYRSISQRFGVGKATAVRTVRRVTLALTTLAKKYIVWPTGEAAVGVIDGFTRSSGFPGVIGAIDGTHIEIPAPNESAAAYVNRKGYHSIHLQVCMNLLIALIAKKETW